MRSQRDTTGWEAAGSCDAHASKHQKHSRHRCTRWSSPIRFSEWVPHGQPARAATPALRHENDGACSFDHLQDDYRGQISRASESVDACSRVATGRHRKMVQLASFSHSSKRHMSCTRHPYDTSCCLDRPQDGSASRQAEPAQSYPRPYGGKRMPFGLRACL